MDTPEEKSKIEIIEIKKGGTRVLNFQRAIFIIGIIFFSPLTKLCWLVGNGWLSLLSLSSDLISGIVKKLNIENNARIVLSSLEMKSNTIVKNLLN